MENETEEQAITPEPLLQMIFGGFVQQCISVIAKLGIPDLLKDGPKSHEQLAVITDAHAPSLYRLMRMLSSIGIFTELENKTFAIRPLGIYLQSDTIGSVRTDAIFSGEKWRRNAWTNLLFSVRTGKSAFTEVHGQGLFEYMSDDPEAAEGFNNLMSEISRMVRPALAYYDFSEFDRLVDVGGGHGEIMRAILEQYPHMQGTVYDLPAVIEGTRHNMRAAGLEHRCDCVGGNFFESVPPGGDAYLMMHIIHDWSDEEAATILRHCRQQMRENGKLILLDAVILPGDAPDPAKLLDIEMLVITHGKERTELEFQELFMQSGFKLSRIIPTPTPVCIIEGIPV
jgi:hypothetical protein